VGQDGRVFDKSFIANHRIRETVDNLLQESFGISRPDRGESYVVFTPHLTAEAYFASPTVRRGQLFVLTVEVALAVGLHVYGRPLPDGYIPIEVVVDGGDALSLTRIAYPEPREEQWDVGGERLPIYSGRLTLKAYGVAVNEDRPGNAQANVRLRYQACDDRKCFLPETVTFRLPLEILPHDWERLD